MHATGPAPRLSDFLVVARAVVLATVVLVAGSVSHLLGNGLLPPPAALLLLHVLTAVGCTFFLQRPAGVLRLMLLVVGGQTAIHLALSIAAGHAGEPASSTTPMLTPSSGQSLHEAYLAQQDAIWAAGNTGPDPLVHLVQHALEAGPLMLAAHTGAAAVVALWLAVGERALATLLALTVHNLRRAVRALRAVLAALMPHLPPTTTAATTRVTLTHTSEIARRAISRRGPPRLVCT